MFRALLLLLAAVLAAPLSAQEGSGQSADADALRKRWETLDPESREALRGRYERLRSMSPEERERALTLAKRLRAESDEMLRSLEPAEREAIEALEPAERGRVVRALVADRARVMAARLRLHMTDEERARIKDASSAERAAILGAVRARVMGELPRKARRMGETLGLSPKELERFSSADPKERRAGMISLARRRAAQHVRTQGLPDSVTEADWERISKLPDGAFVRAVQRLRARHPEFAVPPRRMERERRRRAELATQMMSLGTPSARERARRPEAHERFLRRGAVLRNRKRIEDAVARKLMLPVEIMARVRTLDDDDFLGFHRQMVDSLADDPEPHRSVERWLNRRARMRSGRGPAEGRRGPGRPRGGGRDAGGRESGGRESSGRSSGGRRSSGRRSGGRSDDG